MFKKNNDGNVVTVSPNCQPSQRKPKTTLLYIKVVWWLVVAAMMPQAFKVNALGMGYIWIVDNYAGRDGAI